MHSTTFFRDNPKSSPFVSLMSKSTYDEPKSPPSPMSPGLQKRVRFSGDSHNDVSTIDDQHTSILFRPAGIAARPTVPTAFDDIDNSRRITSNFLFSNTSLPYDFGIMGQMAIEQPTETPDFVNNSINFIHAGQRTNIVNESGNDGTWLTIFGFRTPAEARILFEEFGRYGVIEKHIIIEESNLFHIKFATRLQAKRALTKHGHTFGQLMIGVRLCTDKDIIGLKPISNANAYLENPFLIRSRQRPGFASSLLSAHN